MLVKRIAGHLREQDWTAVVIEFFIVFVGIYAAFELERWRELEADRRDHENFVRMLSIELEEKLPDARNRVDQYQQLRDDQASVIRWLNGDEPPSQFTEAMCLATFRSLVLNWSATRLEIAELMVTAEWEQSVQDMELRRLLLALGSLQERANRLFDRFVLQVINISDRYPELLQRRDIAPEEYRQGLVCNAVGMRASQAFKNQVFGNIGRQTGLLEIRQRELELLEKIAAKTNQLQL